MTSIFGELPLSYLVLSERRRCGSASAVHEPSPAGPPYRTSSIAPATLSTRATPPRRSPESSAARVRLHLKPGQKGTKQLLAQYGDRLICVRYRYTSRFADVAVRDRVKQAGGTWNPARRVWHLRYDRAVALGLTSRVVDEPASNSGCPGSSGQNLHADAGAPSR
ncbi:MAG: hypothetical protein Q8S13_14190 [Dehalococcoidia bacterium]|nr:hypothetical protein [Dehalococcoidia bacterium]